MTTMTESVVGSPAAQAALLKAVNIVVGDMTWVKYVVTFERTPGKKIIVRAQKMGYGTMFTERSLGELGINSTVADDPLALEAGVRRLTGTLGDCAVFILEEEPKRAWLWVTPSGHTLTLGDKEVRVAF